MGGTSHLIVSAIATSMLYRASSALAKLTVTAEWVFSSLNLAVGPTDYFPAWPPKTPAILRSIPVQRHVSELRLLKPCFDAVSTNQPECRTFADHRAIVARHFTEQSYTRYTDRFSRVSNTNDPLSRITPPHSTLFSATLVRPRV